MNAFCRMPYLFVTCRFFFLTSDCVPGAVEDFFCVLVWAKKNTHSWDGFTRRFQHTNLLGSKLQESNPPKKNLFPLKNGASAT